MPNISLTVADCNLWLRNLPSDYADCAIYDPPYFMGNKPFKNKKKSYERMTADWDNQWSSRLDYLAWCRTWLLETHRVLKLGAPLLVFGSMHTVFDLYTLIRDLTVDNNDNMAYTMRNMVTWCLPNAPPIFMAKAMGVYAYSTQYIVYATKGKAPTLFFDYDYLREVNGGVQQRDWLLANQESNTNRVGHPSQKPQALMAKLVRTHCGPDSLLIDCFAGSGTTLLAGAASGLNAHGCDASTDYVHAAKTRILKLMTEHNWHVQTKGYEDIELGTAVGSSRDNSERARRIEISYERTNRVTL